MLAANDMQTNIGFKVHLKILEEEEEEDDDDDANNAVLLSTMKQCIKRTWCSKIFTFDIALEKKQQTHILWKPICPFGERHDN